MTKGERRTSPWVVVLAVVGGLVVLCCVGGGIVSYFGAKQVAESGGMENALRGFAADMAGERDTVAREFFRVALQEHDAPASYARTSAAFQATATPEQFDELLRGIRRVMGMFQAAQIRNYQANTRIGTGAGTVHQLTYDATFENGAGTIHINLREDGETLLVEMFRVESPLFLRALTGDENAGDATDDDAVPPTDKR